MGSSPRDRSRPMHLGGGASMMGSRTGGHRRWPTGQGGTRYPGGAQGGGVRAGRWPEAQVDGGVLAARAYGAS
jgi:hypothetical protein